MKKLLILVAVVCATLTAECGTDKSVSSADTMDETLALLAGEFSNEPILSYQVIPHGLLSRVYLVELPSGYYIFRFLPEEMTDTHFLREGYITRLIAENGIGPCLIHLSYHLKAFVLEYVEDTGKEIFLDKLQNEDALLEALGEKIYTLHHCLKPEPFAYIKRATENIYREGYPVPSAFDAFERELLEMESIFQNYFKTTLIHNDLHLSNLLYDGEEIYLIDWTSATIGYPLFDLVKIAYRIKDKGSLLRNYLKREPTEKEWLEYQLTEQLLKAVRVVFELGQYGKHCTASWSEMCHRMDLDYQRMDVKAFDLKLYTGKERSYWSALLSLKELLLDKDKRYQWFEDLRCV